MPDRQWRAACGYLTICVAPLALVAGAWGDCPWLGFLLLFVVAPFMRLIVGELDVQAGAPDWQEDVARFLHALPRVAAVMFIGAVVATLPALAVHRDQVGYLIWHSLSLWAVLMFSSCVAHELVHRRGTVDRTLGALLAGAAGYPFLEHEHAVHHRGHQAPGKPEWPLRSESLWAFTARRWPYALLEAVRRDAAVAEGSGSRFRSGLTAAVCGTVAMAFAYFVVSGLSGLAVFLAVALAVGWGLQAMTYVQHWGLSADELGRSPTASHLAWEDTCRLQHWLSLGISAHQSHHNASGHPYYRLSPSAESPRQPAGYIVLLVCSLVPALWRRVMSRPLDRWLAGMPPQEHGGRPCVAPPMGD